MPRTPVTTPAIEVYVPPSVGNPHAVLYNNGSSPAYLGGSAVTPVSGLWFPPGATISYPFAPYGIWAVAGGQTVGTPSTTLVSATSTGGTVVILTGTAATTGGAFGTGATFAIGTSTGIEYVTVATYTAGASNGTVTTVNPLLYDHASGATAATITAQSGTNLKIDRGTS